MAEQEKPKKPLTAYFKYQADNKEQVKHLATTERSKVLGDMWGKLPEEEKKRYSEEAKKEMDAYKVALAAFYAKYPEEKVKDEQEAAAKKEKRAQPKEPPGMKADDKNLRIMFFVAYVKKHRDQFRPEFITSNQTAKRVIGKAFEKLQTEGGLETWREKWTNLSLEQKQHIKAFHEEWLKLGKK